MGENMKDIRLTGGGRGDIFLHKTGFVPHGTDRELSQRAVWLPALFPASLSASSPGQPGQGQERHHLKPC